MTTIDQRVTGTRLPAWLDQNRIDRLGGRVAAAGSATSSASAPYTLEPIGAVPRSTTDDVLAAFEEARAAQRAWATTSLDDRAAIVLRFHDLLLARKDEVLDLIQIENGKSRKDAFLEVADIAITSRYYARKSPGLLRPHGRRGAFPVLTQTTERHHPKGVVAVISPWNYPFSLAAGDTIPALLAGNGVVQKPDSQTALTALWAVELMAEAGLPDGLWQIVLGPGRELGSTLMDECDYVMFTGSTATGRQIARDAGERLVGASLELGGKNALLVLDDADLDVAAEGAVRACFASSGQLCISIERLYVPETLQQAFLDRFLERVKAMRLGSELNYDADMGSLTNQAQLEAVTAHVEDARANGATVLAGGRARPDLGPLFFEPTVLADVTSAARCFGEETFGPVVSIYPYRDLDEAVRLANDTPYGLNASVWTRDGALGRNVAARLRAGTVNVNEAYGAAWASVDAPMGGMGDSGLGRRHGAEGLLKYTEAQTVAHARVLKFTPPLNMSYSHWATALTVVLKLMRKARLS